MKKQYIKIILLFAVITASLLFYVWQRFEAVNIGYEIQMMNKEKDRLEFEVNTFELEMNKLSSLARIEDIARNELGMKTPNERDTIILEVDNN